MTHDSRKFTVQPTKKLIVAEESDLGAEPYIKVVYYPGEAEEKGLAIKSSKTGKEACFARFRDLRDGEGELQVTIFRPTKATLQRQPQLRGWELHILND